MMPELRRLAFVFVRLAALGFSLNSGLYTCLYIGNNIVHFFIAFIVASNVSHRLFASHVFVLPPGHFHAQRISHPHRRHYTPFQQHHAVPAPAADQIDVIVAAPPLGH
jgi:hypothetical protein